MKCWESNLVTMCKANALLIVSTIFPVPIFSGFYDDVPHLSSISSGLDKETLLFLKAIIETGVP